MPTTEKRLFLAARDGRAVEVSSLLSDNPEIDVNNQIVFHDTNVAWTPLTTTSRWGYAAVVKLLLAHPGINVNLKNGEGGTVFSLACQYGRESVVRLMLKDPRVDVTQEDDSGCTPLWYAAACAQLEVIRWLIASGRDGRSEQERAHQSRGTHRS